MRSWKGMGSDSSERLLLIISPLDVGFQILITSSGKVDDNKVVWIKLDLIQGMDGMGRFDGRNYPFCSAE